VGWCKEVFASTVSTPRCQLACINSLNTSMSIGLHQQSPHLHVNWLTSTIPTLRRQLACINSLHTSMSIGLHQQSPHIDVNWLASTVSTPRCQLACINSPHTSMSIGLHQQSPHLDAKWLFQISHEFIVWYQLDSSVHHFRYEQLQLECLYHQL
jgi:hypothetical protein